MGASNTLSTCLVLTLLAACSVPPDDRPDVIILSVETLRADYAEPMAALTDGAHVFRQATTPLPRTTPALASLWTGRTPERHGSREVGQPIQEGTSLAVHLQAAGWSTRAISAIRVAGPEQGLDAGFERFEVMHDARAQQVVDRALALATAASTDRPLLLWVHLADPHFPYLPVAEVEGAEPCRTLSEDAEAGRLRRVDLHVDRDGRASAALAACRALYRAEVEQAAAALQWLTAALDQVRSGRTRYLIFTSDHGEHLGEDGLFYEHGPSLHDAALRVPLAVAGPGVPPGPSDAVAQLQDIAPTVLSLLDLPIPEDVDGYDLSRRWILGEPGPTVALAESGSALHRAMAPFVVSGRVARACWHGPTHTLCRTRRGETLHHRATDPALKVDVSDQEPAILVDLRAQAERWPAETARELAARTPTHKLRARPVAAGGRTRVLVDLLADPGEQIDTAAPDIRAALTAALGDPPQPPTVAPRDDETIQQLKALGYID